MDYAQAYKDVYQRICSIVSERSADVEVPTCPGWTVKDVIAHCAGFFDEYKNKPKEEAFSQDWGDQQVDKRKMRSLQECLSEWTEYVQDPGDLFDSHLAPVALSDVLAHEQDIRTAVDEPGGQDDENIVPAVEMALNFVAMKAEGADLPGLRIVTDDVDKQVGQGEPVATLRASTFELFRALHGRRTEDQLRAMDWEGEADPFIPILPIFGPTKEKVEA
jgi:uncharacterized protein (TIGR03083 family)